MCGTYHVDPELIPAGEQVEVPCPGNSCFGGESCSKTIIIHQDAYAIPMSGGVIYTCEDCAVFGPGGIKEKYKVIGAIYNGEVYNG